MRNARPFIIIAISVVIGLIAVALAAQWVGKQPNLATTRVVVAARDLPVGTRLQPDMVKLVEWPAGTPLKDPIREVDKAQDRVITTAVVVGEPIIAAKLAPPGETGGLSAVLAPGKRAITVKVTEIAGVAGFALPGNYVDVMVNTPDEGSRQPISKIVLERILVLAVAQEASPKDNKPRVVDAVTLEVTPEQAENIDLARSVGSLSLVLRNQTDPLGTVTAGARKADLLRLAAHSGNGRTAPPAAQGAKPAPAAAPRRPAPPPKVAKAADDRPSFEVIRGVKKSTEFTLSEPTT